LVRYGQPARLIADGLALISKFNLRKGNRTMNTKRFLSVFVLLLQTLILSGPTHAAQEFGTHFRARQIRRACQTVQDADIGWYRGLVTWNEVMNDEGNLNFEKLDRRIRITLNHGIKPFLILKSVHELFAPDSGTTDLGHKAVWRSAPPASVYLNRYISFVREIVERYDGDGFSDATFITEKKNVKYWQIENEPGRTPDQEGSNFWKGTAADYAGLYLVAYDVIKQADPDAHVALSGFTWRAMIYGRNHGVSFPLEVLGILNERGGDFDIFDVHFYKDYRKFFRFSYVLYDFLDTFNQFSLKPIWIAETNVDSFQMDPYLTPEEYNTIVAKDIVKRHCVLFGRGVQKVFWFNLSDKATATWKDYMGPKDFQKFSGSTDKDFIPKPVYYTYKLLIEKIGGWKKFRRMRRQEPDSDTWIYKAPRNGGRGPVYILWYDNPDNEWREVQISLPWDQVLITHVITEAGITEAETEIRSTSNGELQIVLDDRPVFVEKYPPPN
jgi:hypothetical protein